MAERNVYPAFGYVVLKTTYKPSAQGETGINDPSCSILKGTSWVVPSLFDANKSVYSDTDFGEIWFYTKGHVRVTNKNTNTIQDRPAGFCNLDTPEVVGSFVGECLEEAVVFSIEPRLNYQKSPVVPMVSTFKLQQGNTFDAPVGTKLFLAQGTLTIDGKQFTDGAQIGVYTSQKTLQGVTDCYGFVFK